MQSTYYCYTTTDAFKMTYNDFQLVVIDKRNNTIKCVDNIANLRTFYSKCNQFADNIHGFLMKRDSSKFF